MRYGEMHQQIRICSGASHLSAIQNIINEYLKQVGKNVRVLEAGAGSSTHFYFQQSAVIDGLDISREVMRGNSRLNRRIVRDLQSYQTNNRYDIVICWTVLEHLRQPIKALSNITSWTVDGGLVIISVPNVFSLKGLATKVTPIWIHRWAYKNIFHFTSHAPFTTYLRFSLSPSRIIRFFRQNDFLYIGFGTMALSGILRPFYCSAIAIMRIISFGYYHPEWTDFYIVIKKRDALS